MVRIVNRRGFISLLGMSAAGLALDRAIPLGRVWSFPKEIVIAPPRLNEEDAISIARVEDHARSRAMFEVGDIVSFPNFGGALCLVTAVTANRVDLNGGPGWKVPHYLLSVPEDCLRPHSGRPPGAPPVNQLKSPRDPVFLPALGMP